MQRKRHVPFLAALVVLLLVGAACGEDTPTPDGEETTTPAAQGIQSTEDLGEGHVVGVQGGTTGEAWTRDNLEDQGVEIRSFPEGPDAYAALEACQLDAAINDEPTALAEVAERTDLELIETIDTGESYGIAVNPENQELLDAVNIALAQIIDDGTYEEIYSTYEDLPPGGSVVENADTSAAAEEVPTDVPTREEGVLTVGSDIPYPPFEFREGGELVGLDIDLVNEIASRLGLETEIIDTDFDTIFTQVGAGRFDVAVAASTITDEREESVNFSDPYYNSQQSLTVNPTCEA